MNALLFFSAPPGAGQQNTLFQSNSRQMQTLHSIMTSGEHSNGIAPVRKLNLERWGIKERWHDQEKEKDQSCWVVQGAQWDVDV